MRTVWLTESTDTRITLSDEEAAGLLDVGQTLASHSPWWGDKGDNEEPSPRSVVSCWAVSKTEYSVRVSEAIGVIGLKQTQLIVKPKIPLPPSCTCSENPIRCPAIFSSDPDSTLTQASLS